MSLHLPIHVFGGADLVLRLGLATLVGMAFGLDRELRGHAAGLRTHALVALSSALVTLTSLELYEATRIAGESSDPLRVVQGLAQAIGFIAAGTIFMARGRVKDLTTAVTIWLASALGIAAGAGQFLLVAVASAIGLFLVMLDVVIDRSGLRRGRAKPPAPES